MSVTIRNMQMPDSCNGCLLMGAYLNEGGGTEHLCCLTMAVIREYESRHPMCPLEDADAEIRHLEKEREMLWKTVDRMERERDGG